MRTLSIIEDNFKSWHCLDVSPQADYDELYKIAEAYIKQITTYSNVL